MMENNDPQLPLFGPEEPAVDNVPEQNLEPELLFDVFMPAGLEVFDPEWHNTVIRPMPKYNRMMHANTLNNFGVREYSDLEWALNIPKFREAMYRFICSTTVSTPSKHPHPTSLRFKGEVGWKNFAKKATDDEKLIPVLIRYIKFLDIFGTPLKIDIKK